MKFSRYSSIENSYRLKTVRMIQEQFPGHKFVVQEKIHGSNFAIYTDGENVKFSKRSGFLKEGESFFSYETLDLKGLTNSLNSMFEYLKKSHTDLQQLSIHGEIFGGSYPHEDVEKVPGATRVQKEVLYSPRVEFMAFDIKVNDEFVSMDVFSQLCGNFNIPHIPFLFSGTLEECLEYSNAFQTTIPELLGLPAIEDNICEGTVVKPLQTLRFNCGSRVVLKNKNEKFSEKGQKSKVKTAEPLPQDVLDMMSKASAYVTENRLRNVLSHVGEVKQNEFGKVLGLMSKDTIEDFMKDNPDFEDMDKKERKHVTRYLNAKIGDLIRPNFRNIIDGNF